jgi:hypothetical protein
MIDNPVAVAAVARFVIFPESVHQRFECPMKNELTS